MAYVIYINDVKKKARLHYKDCDKVRQKSGSGKRGYYRYFDDY